MTSSSTPLHFLAECRKCIQSLCYFYLAVCLIVCTFCYIFSTFVKINIVPICLWGKMGQASRFTPFINIVYMKCSIQSGKTRKHGIPFCPVGTCYIFVWYFSLSLKTNKKLLIQYQAAMQYFPFTRTVFLKVTSYSRNSLQKQLTTIDHKTRQIYCARRTIPLAETPSVTVNMFPWKVYIVNII